MSLVEPKKKVVKKKPVPEEPLLEPQVKTQVKAQANPKPQPKAQVKPKPKPKAVPKKDQDDVAGSDAYLCDDINSFEDIKKAIESSSQTMFDIDVEPKSWVLPNRAKFAKGWLDASFKYPSNKSKPKCEECAQEETCPAVKADSVSLFPHQKFIKDYIQFASPYRGILLYHGLGVGNSCASIAAGEVLMNHMDVMVMLPASLRGNYMNEIKKCGRKFYHLKQRWVFVPTSVFSSHLSELSQLLKVDKDLVQKQGGVWIPHNQSGKKPNFTTMLSNIQKQVVTQMDNIITNRFNFINYNGLKSTRTKKKDDDEEVGMGLKYTYISDMIKNGNPFDGKCVVVDEIHNLISRIVNGGKIGTALYKLLMTAKGCKLILLSGTPIINYPYEVSYLINLLVGPQYRYLLTVSTSNNEQDIETIVDDLQTRIPQIDYIKIADKGNGQKVLKITLLPRGFQYVDRKALEVRRYGLPKHARDDDVIVKDVVDMLKESKVKVVGKPVAKESRILPEDEKEFNKYFVDMEQGKIMNPRLFSRHVLGTVSYYSTYSKELYPEWTVEETHLPMTDHQFHAYEKARMEERKKESKSKSKGGDGGNIFKDTGHVYRFYSRAICNFVFPEDIKRPYPSVSFLKNEVDDEDETIKNFVKKTEKDEDGGKKNQKEYDSLLQQALEKLAKSQGNYLHLNNIGKYSPKFKSIIERIHALKGTSLIYSQFRRVEGLGVLSLALNANGYAEFRIKKGKDGEWDTDIKEEDMQKPKYILFTGNNEETQVLLKIFNSDRENIPPKIRAKLGDLSHDGGVDNIRGSIIKVLMITQSGAEGISLKNVRNVHVVEPYWNYIRIDQVIGRAVRTCSHVDLPSEDRNVQVYIYNTIFTPQQLASSFTIRVQDNSSTTDEHIYKLAKKKAQIINLLLDNIKKASVDCALNAKAHSSVGQVKCFAFPVNLKDEELSYQYDMNDETFDNQYANEVEQSEWKGQVLITKKGNFVIRSETNEVFDYDLYMDSGKLVRIGYLRIVGNQKQVVKNM